MRKKILVGILCFLFTGTLVFFGIQFVTKTGFFRKPGDLLFAESFLDSDSERYRGLFEETELRGNITFSYVNSDSPWTPSNDSELGFLVDVFVPIGDFYETKTSITSDEFEEMYASGKDIVSVKNLAPTNKLLAVDNNYYLDSFDSGAKFKYLRIELADLRDKETVESVIQPTLSSFPDKTSVLSFAQTGVTALGRALNTKMNEVGDGRYFSEKIASFLGSFDLTHTSNESSFSERANGANICSDERFIDTLTSIGLDVVELTGNHNLDCGAEDAINTIDKYEMLGIKVVGGGRNAEEAAIPLAISQKGNSVTVLAYNQSTGGATTDNTPGANQYDEEDAKARISEAKARGDTVIVDMQYYECAEYDTSMETLTCTYADSSAGDQVGTFRSLIDLGADVVVGTSAHQTQTFENYNGSQIYYGLGNIFFDQVWWPGTTKSLGLVHYFWNGKLIQTRKFGTIYDDTFQTRLMTDDELETFIKWLNSARSE